jgi:endonuclease/exonuclease/phosphatase family metal-dependent hydrolase
MLLPAKDPVRVRHRRRWRLHGVLCAAVAGLVVLLSASVPAVRAGAATSFVLVQMNLCNSGSSGCYSFGQAVDEAVANIHRYRPQLVTAQEICRSDLYAKNGLGKLAQAMVDLYGSRQVGVVFAPAHDRRTGGEYNACTNGEAYGVAMVYQGDGRDVHQGWYTNQGGGREVRTWVCATILKHRLTACTTHLTINRDIAVRQCQELPSVLRSSWITPEVIVSGDFNLASEPGQPHDVQSCAAPGYQRYSDGAVQQVFLTGGIQWVQGRHEPLKGTDHPLLMERLRV